MEWVRFFFVVLPIVFLCVGVVVAAIGWWLTADDDLGIALRFLPTMFVIVGVFAFASWVQS